MDSSPDLAAIQKSYERPIEQRVQEAVDGLLGEGRRPLVLPGCASGSCGRVLHNDIRRVSLRGSCLGAATSGGGPPIDARGQRRENGATDGGHEAGGRRFGLAFPSPRRGNFPGSPPSVPKSGCGHRLCGLLALGHLWGGLRGA